MKLSEKKRLAIIVAARQEFIHQGYKQANMTQICDMATVSKRTLYRHFASKELLFAEVLTDIHSEYSNQMHYQYCQQMPLATQLAQIIEGEIEVLYQRYGIKLARMIIAEFIRSPDLAREFVKILHANAGAVNAWMQSALTDGRLQGADASELVTVFNCLYQGYFVWPQVVADAPLATAELKQQQIATIVKVFLTTYASPTLV